MNSPAQTHRWRGVVALSLFAGAVGIVAQQSAVLFLATVGVGYAAYSRLSPSAPGPTLTVERTLSPTRPSVGDDVTVQTVVRNDGDRRLPDLRLVDGVPSLLPVVDGSPRRATALGAGDETTIEYTVEAKEGKHRFQPLTVVSRDVAGATERQVEVHESSVVDCGVPVESAALRDLTRRRAGRLRTDEAGSGIEFHRAREYRQGDPLRQVDWNRFAKRGELSTIEFREEQSAAVVLCVDLGGAARATADGAVPTRQAVARSIGAADQVAQALAGDDHEVGLAALGPEFFWLPPRAGTDHLGRIRDALDTHEAFAPTGTSPHTSGTPEADGSRIGAGSSRGNGPFEPFGPGNSSTATCADGGRETTDGKRKPPDDGQQPGSDHAGRTRQTARIRERLGSNAQVMVFSPLADGDVVDAVRTLEAGAAQVTVVNPDETTDESLGNRLVTVERTTRTDTLRRAGVPVVDWQPGTDLGHALATAQERHR